MNDTGRVRWRMTLDELCHVTARRPHDLERWAKLGAFGPRWKEDRDRGKWRHITKEVAHRAIIMERLVQAGLEEDRAAWIASNHQTKDKYEPLIATMRGTKIIVERGELELP